MNLDELDRLHAAAWDGAWTAETWEVECDARDGCPTGDDCEGSHDCETILAPEAYPSPPGQVVVQTSHADGRITAPGLEQFARANTVAIVALHNAWPAISARLRAAEVDTHNLRGMLGRALDENARLRAEVERLTGEVASLAALVNPQAARDAAYEALENRAALAILATGEDDTLVGAATNAMAMKELYKAMWRRDQGYTHLARQAMTDGLAECERLRGALLLIATGRFASVAEACDIAEDALGADVVAAWNAAENARAALEEP